MRRRGRFSLVKMFVFAVFIIMLVSQMIMGCVYFLAFRMGFFPNEQFRGHPLLLLLAASVILGSIISAVSGKKITSPIRRLIWATNEISKGNYDIRLAPGGANELNDLVHSFNKMAGELSGVEIMRNDFISSISHEFKTPLASIQGYATLLQDDELSHEERSEYTAAIISSARRLSALAGDILKLSKLENQEIVTEKTKFELDEQIRRVILMLEPGWSEKEIELDIELAPVRFTGREELLQQVWLNLLDNAIKFTSPGGTISVRLTDEGKDITVVIADSGAGMSAETVRHIFDKFYQGDNSRACGGNGLGLALVKRIVELVGGSVGVESVLGEGTRFVVRLPAGE